jgi:uracil-DNA glycosylase
LRPLVIGQAPGPNTDPEQPLSGRCGARLADLCGLPQDDFLLLFDRENLVRRFPGKAGKGDHFPAHRARAGLVDLLLFGALSGRPVVMLGNNVARVFGFRPAEVELFRWNVMDGSGLRLALCPHPSGVSRWWNEEANQRAARRFWKALALDALEAELTTKSLGGRFSTRRPA